MPKILVIFVLGCLCLGVARSEEDAPSELQLKVPTQSSLFYKWEILSTNESKGSEQGKSIELKISKNINVTVVLRGREDKHAGDDISASLRFQDLELEEKREAAKDTRTYLKVGRHSILYKEEDRILIDSQNDIGLEKISDYQRNLRGLEAGELRFSMDKRGRLNRSEGNRQLIESLHAGNAQGIFPILPSVAVRAGETWDDRFEIPKLGEVTLKDPAMVLSRMRFTKWKDREGKRLMEFEVIAAWESQELHGEDEHGLEAHLTEIQGLGSGVYFFDPEKGTYDEGNMIFELKYQIDGAKKGASTHLDVKARTKLFFKLEPEGSIGPRRP